MKRIHKVVAGTAGALTLALVTAVSAAPYGVGGGGCGGVGPGTSRMGMVPGGMGPGGGAMRGGYGVDNTAGLATLKTQLAITTEQETAWQAFADQAAEQANQMQAMRAEHRAAAGSDLSAPALMSLRVGAMTQRLASMQAMNTALNGLYQVLTPQQRATADQYFAQPRWNGYRHGRRG